jgi:hypothetical protein
MAVIASDIKHYLTGAGSDGGSQSDPNAALGNYRSSTEAVDNTSENVFDNVTDAERVAGDTEYRCYCIKNTNGADSLLNAVIWISIDTGNGEDDISFAVEVPTGGDQNGNAQTIANESTAPSVGAGNVSAWSDATSKGSGVTVDQGSHDVNLDAGEIVFVWVRRVISAGATGVDDEAVTIKIEGDT